MFSVQRILVPVDYSEVSRAAISVALQLADRHQAEVWVLHVQEGMDKALQRRIVSAPNDSVIEEAIESDEKNLRSAVELEYQRAKNANQHLATAALTLHISGGDWLEVALQLIQDEEIDLVVSGTHGPKGIKGMLMGSVTEQLVHRAVCSVFVVKPQGYPYLRD